MAGLARGERLRSASQGVARSGSSRSSASSSGSTGILGAAAHQDQRADLVGPGERRLERDQRAQRVADQHRGAEAERAASSPTASR